MVSVAQLVERRIVIPVVVGSIPIAHPTHATGTRRKLIGCEATLRQVVITRKIIGLEATYSF